MTRSDDRSAMQERILETADRLFYGQGIRAVGVDTIAAEIGISKRTLYNYFPSKDDLIVAYLSRRIRPGTVSDLPSELQWPDVAITAVASFVISFVATVYPSYRAAKVNPAEALRYE